MSFKKVVKLSMVVMVLSNQAFAAQAEIKKESATGDMKVKFCDASLVPQRSYVGFQIENGIIQKESVNAEKCSLKSFSRGSLAEGKKLKIHKMSRNSEDSEGLLLETVLKENSGNTGGGERPVDQTVTVINNIKFTITTLENANGVPTKIKMVACHDQFKPSDAVSVTNRNTLGSQQNVSKSSFVTRDKCFDVEFKKGEIQDGDEIGIGLASVARPISVKVYNIPWKRDQATNPGTNPGGGNGGGTVIVTPPPGGGNGGNNGGPTTPVLPSEPSSTVRERARNAADQMAKNISKSLGQVENIRYNLFLGFQEEERRANYYGASISGHREYQYQYGVGLDLGKSEGYSAGLSHAALTGRDYARADVSAAVEAIMNGQAQSIQVRKRQNLSQMPFDGLTQNLSVPATVVERLKQQDQELQKDLSSRFYTVDNEIVVADDLINGRFEIYKLYGQQQYKFELLDSYFREQKAFEYFKRGYFQPRQGALRYYQEISDDTKYSNADQNERIFREVFESRYDDVIPSRWNEVVKAERYDVQRMGRDLYSRLTSEYAIDLGKYDGRRAGYKAASRDGFLNQIQVQYDSYVEQVVRDVQSRAVITDTPVKATAADGGIEVTIGDSIDLILGGAANRGAVAGNVEISPVATTEVVALKPVQTVSVPGFSKLNQAVMFKGMLFVSKLSAADQSVTVQFKVNGELKQAQLRATFEGLVVGLARQSNAQTQGVMVQHLVSFLKKEWEDKKQLVGDGFDNKKGDLLVERMMARILAMSGAEKAAIKKFTKDIKGAYGDRPGFLNGYRGDWDSAMEILKGL